MVTVPPSRAAPIIERAPLPLVEVHGSEHLVSHVNSAFCRLVGKARGDMVGKRFCDIVPGGTDCLPLLDQVYETGQAITHKLEDPDAGETAWLYAMWPALDPDERPEGVIIAMTTVPSLRQNLAEMNEALLIAGLHEQESKDKALHLNAQLGEEIAERKHAAQDLSDANIRLAETDRNKNEFLAMLAHELRNPLAPILSAAHLIRAANSDDAKIVRAQAVIERQVEHLSKLVDELLDLSRIQEGKIKLERVHLDLASAVERAVESCDHMIKEHHHTLVVDVPAGAPLYVDADPTRIDQVLVNLIRNAAKYTRSGGRIEIKVGREKGIAILRIRDNGVGIARENLQRVFELFTQVEQSLERSQGGLGLGLKLVKELVELHGGEIAANSEGLGRGSEFIIRLPAIEVAEPVAPPEVPHRAVHGSPKRILVVDDSPDIRDTMEMVLSSEGHSVGLAEDGKQAVEMALRGHHDVAFVDIGLPTLSGYEVAKAIRSRPEGARIVLIAVSGYGQPEDKRKAIEAGFDAHLTKPVKAGRLKQLLNDLEQFNR